MRQGSRSVAEYSVELCTLSAEAGWNDPALQTAFRWGLNDPVRDALVLGSQPASLNALVDRAIELDNRHRERRRERSSHLSLPRHLSVHLRSPQLWIRARQARSQCN